MSQRTAADEWQVSLSTMQALERGDLRKYRPETLAQFNEVLRRDTWELYDQPASEVDEEPSAFAQLDAVVERLTSRLDEQLAAMAGTNPRPSWVDEWERLGLDLDGVQRGLVVTCVRALLDRAG